MARVTIICETCKSPFAAYSGKGLTKCKGCRDLVGPKPCLGCGAMLDRGKRCGPCAEVHAAAYEAKRCKRDRKLNRAYAEKAVGCEGCATLTPRGSRVRRHIFCSDCMGAQAAFQKVAHRTRFPEIEKVKAHAARVEAALDRMPQVDGHVKTWRRYLDKIEAAQEKPWLHPELGKRERDRLRRKLDPNAILYDRTRCRLRRKRVDGRYPEIMRRAMNHNNGKYGKKIERFLGYTMDDLRRHIERQFTKGMNWAVFATGAIHIDHIKPLNTFDLDDPEEVKAAWSISNLRPLWANANMRRPKDGSDVLI